MIYFMINDNSYYIIIAQQIATILNMILLVQGTEIPDGYIPEVPPIPDLPIAPEVTDILNALGEPTMESLGLGLAHWTPPGLVQAALEYMHVSMGVPWWAAIVAGQLLTQYASQMLIFKETLMF